MGGFKIVEGVWEGRNVNGKGLDCVKVVGKSTRDCRKLCRGDRAKYLGGMRL